MRMHAHTFGSGEVLVDGRAPPASFFRSGRVAFCPQDAIVLSSLSPREAFTFAAAMHVNRSMQQQQQQQPTPLSSSSSSSTPHHPRTSLAPRSASATSSHSDRGAGGDHEGGREDDEDDEQLQELDGCAAATGDPHPPMFHPAPVPASASASASSGSLAALSAASRAQLVRRRVETCIKQVRVYVLMVSVCIARADACARVVLVVVCFSAVVLPLCS